jgi:hypothetical protein
MYQQAGFELDLAGDIPLARQLRALFLGRAQGEAALPG